MSIVKSVKKRNGRLVPYEPDKINRSATRACEGLSEVSPSELVLDAQLNLYDKIPTVEIDTALVMSAREKIQKVPEYSYVAARILFSTVYRDSFGDNVNATNFDDDYRKAFKKHIRKFVRDGALQQGMVDLFDLDRLADSIVIERDDDFRYVGAQILTDRYLMRDENRRVVETPQAFWMRIAMGLSLHEDYPTDKAIEFYHLFSQFRYTPSTPTLFNSGLRHSQLSSCFLNTFDDSIHGIFEGLWQEARKSKYSGGLGFDVTPFRATGAAIDGTDGICKGLIPWLRLFNDMLIAVNQKGKRPGAGCAYLEPWHKDFPKFIELRRNAGDERLRTHDMNTATWAPDIFMRRIQENGDWYMFCPNECPDLHDLYGKAFDQRYEQYCQKAEAGEIKNFSKTKAKDLWKKMIAMMFETSHPWLTFKDPCNMRYANQHEGVVHSSNLCTEIVELTKPSKYDDVGNKTEVGETAVCNLGSINLKNHTKPVYRTRTEPVTKDKYQEIVGYEVDWDKLKETIEIARRILDNVIDLNYYPTEETKKSNLRHRPVGLGVMGLHDMLHLLNIQIDSEQAVNFNDSLFEFISLHSHLANTNLAEERGAYKSFKGSLWDQGRLPIDTWQEQLLYRGGYPADAPECLSKSSHTFWHAGWDLLRERIAQHGMRNSLSLAIAPTATLSYINGVEQSIEPNPSVLFVQENKSGNFYIVNEYFIEDMRKEGLWNPAMADAVRAVDGDVLTLPIPDKYKQKYASVRNRDMIRLIQSNAARQKWLDQSQSFNMYYFGSSSKDINDIYMAAWQYGLKTTYYLRGTGATKIEKSTVDTKTALGEAVQEQLPSTCSLDAMMRGEICESCS